jgi:hypothetical protein
MGRTGSCLDNAVDYLPPLEWEQRHRHDHSLTVNPGRIATVSGRWGKSNSAGLLHSRFKGRRLAGCRPES